MTAPDTRYAVRIHEDMLYDTSKSLIRSGMAGINIVSAYITIVAMQLSIASTFHAEAGTLTELDEEREEECKLEAESLPLLVFLVFL
jgi:hypothetical protein